MLSASSLTVTCCAAIVRISTAKVFIPPPQEEFLVCLYESPYAVNFSLTETPAVFKPNRVKPELGFVLFALDVDVGRFITVA